MRIYDPSEKVNLKMSNAVTTPPAEEEAVVQFLDALFAPGEYLLLRPIESWIENDRKKSKVDYRGTQYSLVGLRDQEGNWQTTPSRLANAIKQQKQRAEQTKANIFFGVCPRVGTGGKFDLAWHNCTVRALWTDIDYVSVEEVRERIAKADMPLPSIIVNSGNGVHLYWLLDTPYLIDDAGDPPPVHTDWIKARENGRNRENIFLKTATRSISTSGGMLLASAPRPNTFRISWPASPRRSAAITPPTCRGSSDSLEL